MAFETPHDGSGTVLTFNSVTYTVTNVVGVYDGPDCD